MLVLSSFLCSFDTDDDNTCIDTDKHTCKLSHFFPTLAWESHEFEFNWLFGLIDDWKYFLSHKKAYFNIDHNMDLINFNLWSNVSKICFISLEILMTCWCKFVLHVNEIFTHSRLVLLPCIYSLKACRCASTTFIETVAQSIESDPI